MQLHPGSRRNHNRPLYERFGRDIGGDIPGPIDYVDGLRRAAQPLRQRPALPARGVHARRDDVLPRARPARRPLPRPVPRPAVVVPRQRRGHAPVPSSRSPRPPASPTRPASSTTRGRSCRSRPATTSPGASTVATSPSSSATIAWSSTKPTRSPTTSPSVCRAACSTCGRAEADATSRRRRRSLRHGRTPRLRPAVQCAAASSTSGSARSLAPTSRSTSTTCSRRATRAHRRSRHHRRLAAQRRRAARARTAGRPVHARRRRRHDHRRTGSSAPCRRALHAPSEADAVRDALALGRHDDRLGHRHREGLLLGSGSPGASTAAHPDVRHDVDHPDVPRSVVGHLVLAARDRRDTGGGAISPCSASTTCRPTARRCASVVTELAAVGDPSLAEWIDEHLAFPNSVVDRIVPATDDDFREAVASVDRRRRRAGRYAPSRIRSGSSSARWATPMPRSVTSVCRWWTTSGRGRC